MNFTRLRTFAARQPPLPRPDATVPYNVKFFTGFWVKNFVGCSFTLDSQCGRLWLSMPPATGTHTGVWHQAGNEQGPAERREARARNGVAPYIPVSFCRDAGSAGHGATEAARPERSLQAKVSRQGWKARQGGDSSAGSVHDSPPRQGDARESHKQERNGNKKRKKNSNRHGNHRKITSEYIGHITNGKGNGLRASVARFPSGRRQPARGFRAG